MSKTKRHVCKWSAWAWLRSTTGICASRECVDCGKSQHLHQEELTRRLNAYERRVRYEKVGYASFRPAPIVVAPTRSDADGFTEPLYRKRRTR